MEQIVLLLMHSQMTLHFNSLNYWVIADYVFSPFIIPFLATQAVYSLSVEMKSLTSRKKKKIIRKTDIFLKVWVSPLERFQAAGWHALLEFFKGIPRRSQHCWRQSLEEHQEGRDGAAHTRHHKRLGRDLSCTTSTFSLEKKKITIHVVGC